jgi:hypothetical protein
VNINELANTVCRELPEDWEMVIAMEAGAAVVNLYSPQGDHCEDASNFGDPIEDQVLQAVGYAKAEAKEAA